MSKDFQVYLEDILESISRIHDYGAVNLETVWNIIKKDLEPLEKQIKMIVGKTRQF